MGVLQEIVLAVRSFFKGTSVPLVRLYMLHRTLRIAGYERLTELNRQFLGRLLAAANLTRHCGSIRIVRGDCTENRATRNRAYYREQSRAPQPDNGEDGLHTSRNDRVRV